MPCLAIETPVPENCLARDMTHMLPCVHVILSLYGTNTVKYPRNMETQHCLYTDDSSDYAELYTLQDYGSCLQHKSTCLFRLCLKLNDLLHTPQVYGRSPLCIL
jgi:hypothetical protein